jgi:hypothetical protein
MTQRQEFRVIRSYKGFELREYLPCSIAEVKVSADTHRPEVSPLDLYLDTSLKVISGQKRLL